MPRESLENRCWSPSRQSSRFSRRTGSPRPAGLETARYLENLRRREEHPPGFRIVAGAAPFGVPEDGEVYNLRKGVFEFYLIEDQGGRKVPTPGFEL
jgi:hypothetical protein